MFEQPVPKLCFNVRQTKNEYSKVNNLALRGFEVSTYHRDKPDSREAVSHVKKAIFDDLLNRVTFTADEIYDEELHGWTVAIPEIDLYGESASREAAVQDLIYSIHQYISLYMGSDFLSKHESAAKQAAILRLMRCENDDELLKVLGL
jgi:hypothetical protein